MSAYPLSTQVLTEYLATLTFIFLGNSVISNELLSQTKGHSIGFGFVCLSFGMSVGFSINMFGYCSAYINPASVFSHYLRGDVPGINVVPLMLAELAGAFTGQLLVFTVYLPHFMIVPELGSSDTEEDKSLLLKSGKQIGQSALFVSSHKPSLQRIVYTKDDRELQLYEAAVQADQATKLSAFCNRPAIDMPLCNFICEVICSFVLFLGVALIEDRYKIKENEVTTDLYSKGLLPLMLSFYVMMCVMCLGGPTGFSTNPARDLGPRIAHYILPIKGKGSSRFHYSVIVVVAAYLGGALAAGAFLLLKKLPIR